MKRRYCEARFFTLMEMAVVVAIIALTAAIVMPVYFNHVKKAKIGTAKTQISLLEQAIMDFRLDTGNLPGSLEDLNKNPGNDKWNGPYLQKAVPKDPWNNPYIYTVPGTHGDYDLVSYGSDNQPGGTGESADLANWDAQP
ncbi:MAG TPA: type II secretion system protein GspG [Lentisphaeria bacterium]|nr:MAG: type II secretion system protein GspG [Lentisphaerae bacterium GWF2_50_93]HCE42726.1 type II secretion system protein GspG [Lentisphaeria bacterium]